MEDIDFDVLLSTEPGKHPTAEENSEEAQKRWQKWEEQYAFKDEQKQLVVDTIMTRNNESNTMALKLVGGYGVFHQSVRRIKYLHQFINVEMTAKALRTAKYVALFSFMYKMYYNRQHQLSEFKKYDVYEYIEKRERLKNHCAVARQMWTYCSERYAQQAKVQEELKQQE